VPRQRLAPGEHGKITERASDGIFYATTYVRDSDGKRRRVERSSSKSAEDARRILQRHLNERRAPVTGTMVNDKTTLNELFECWVDRKVQRRRIKPQTANQYRHAWGKHGAPRMGELRIAELTPSTADKHIQDVAAVAPAQARYLRMILREMYSLAVRFEVIDVNPIAAVEALPRGEKNVRAVTPEEFAAVRAAVAAYIHSRDGKGGPRPGRLLPAFIEVLAATGARPGEVLALRWEDVDLLADPPTVTIRGTLLDHGADGPLHRQDGRKHGAPEHTVVLPKFGVEALASLVGESGMSGPVFASRDGGWVSLANMRRNLRAALPPELSWVTPHSFRRTVATVVQRELGLEVAQRQLSHSELSTTERHYVQRQTLGPDVRGVLDNFAGQESGD
jgi:integrase